MCLVELPQAPPKWDHTPEQILECARAVIGNDRSLYDRLAAVPLEQCTFETIIKPLAISDNEGSSLSMYLSRLLLISF